TDLIHRVEEALNAKVVNAYGQSESPHITMTRPSDSPDDRANTVGHPFPPRDVCIMSPDGSGIVHIGEIGEICTRGPLVMEGYLGRYDTNSAIDTDGWLDTGDLGS